jgi:phage terminase large subunit-like protein
MSVATEAAVDQLEIRPQTGPQEAFMCTDADIAVFGGAAGAGKSYALLLDPLRWCIRTKTNSHIDLARFGAVIFRRTYPQIRNEGGLWDTSHEIYPHLGAAPKLSGLDWQFPSGARIGFAHMQHEQDREQWTGAQIPMIGFDQLESFTWRQFFYMLSRNRSTCGVRPYIRATCNPDPDHWLRKFMSWWIDDETGLPILSRSGVLRWFIVRKGNEIVWASHPSKLVDEYGPAVKPKSFTFIPGTIEDNKILLSINPDYLSNLEALGYVDRERLRWGNWNARESAGLIFNKHWFEVVDVEPMGMECIRHWDRAATPSSSPNAASASYTAGVRMGRSANGIFYITDVCRFQGSGFEVEKAILNSASQEGWDTTVGMFQDPGAAGKNEAEDMIRKLAGYNVQLLPTAPDKKVTPNFDFDIDSPNAKVTYAKAWSRQAEAGNIKLVRGEWNEAFLREAEAFDGTGRCDQIDATSGAFALLVKVRHAGTW